jgi:hypothetical protein
MSPSALRDLSCIIDIVDVIFKDASITSKWFHIGKLSILSPIYETKYFFYGEMPLMSLVRL